VLDSAFPNLFKTGTRTAGSDDALTRAMSTIKQTAQFDMDENLLKTAYDRARSDFYAEREAQVADLGEQYKSRIDELRDELAGYKGGRAGVNAAYASYATDANAILSEAAAVKEDPLDPSTADESAIQTFDDHAGVMQETLQKIDSSGNKALATAMSNEVRYMEETMADGIRSGLASQQELHALAGAEASALANMAWKDDVYQAEKSRFVLDTEIKKRISDQEEAIAKTTAEMNAAMARARAEFGDFAMTPDQLWAAGMEDFFSANEFDDMTKQEMTATWQGAMSVAGAKENFEVFKGVITGSVNTTNMATIGILPQWNQLMSAAEAQAADGDPSVLNQMNTAMKSVDFQTVLDTIKRIEPRMWEEMRPRLQNLDTENLETMQDFENQQMLNMWKHYKDFSQNYNDYTQIQAQNYNTPNVRRGKTAPNNAKHKNNPDYLYRKNTVAPYFAQKVMAAFPGAAIGGLRYVRPANNKGGANVSNSDHHSGGAIDVYHKGGSAEETDRMLRNIVRWADQPGVSFTVYDGQSAHQTGTSNAHVHISFQVGWKVPRG
jgi:hypothetical protein